MFQHKWTNKQKEYDAVKKKAADILEILVEFVDVKDVVEILPEIKDYVSL